MPEPDPASWSDRLPGTLRRYDEALLRKVAGRLVRPRGQWPPDELIRRCLDLLGNPVMLDRRLADLAPAGRRVLALIGYSRQPCWALGNLVELLMALGEEDGVAPILDLLESGLLYPLVEPVPEEEERPTNRLTAFEHWLTTAGSGPSLSVFCLPGVASRATGVDLGLPDLSESEPVTVPVGAAPMEGDGQEWLLRLGVLWQQVAEAPLRRTQQGGFFKRDVERLDADPLLNAPPVDRVAAVPDLGFLLALLAERVGILKEVDGEIRAGTLPSAWEEGLAQAIEQLWGSLFQLRGWTPQEGWKDVEATVGNPFPSAYLLLFLLLARMRSEAWIPIAPLEAWILEQHPYWMGESVRPSRTQPWVETFLMGVCLPLRLVQGMRGAEGAMLVRLSPTGRWLLGMGDPPPPPPPFPRTLLVQPNLEILAYRQGLTPLLIARLTRFAAWKTLGAACTLQLEPGTVYRALENGETFDSICQALEQHGTRTTPPAVLDSLRTWANKRDRITVFPSASLLEFLSPQELDEALARGVPGIRVSDTVLVVPGEDQIEFRHFRLTGTRDYALPPERCVTVEPDGVTLMVDLLRSDLMLETELPRFAELIDRGATGGKRQYRLTAASLNTARQQGMTLAQLETWFQQRTGQPVTPAARLLLNGAQLPPPVLRRHLVLHVEVPEIADGLMQWPVTRALIAERLGPIALSIAEENLDALKGRLDELGITVQT